MTLNQLKPGQSASIVQLNLTHTHFSQHCNDLGIAIGNEVELMRRAPGRGPLQIKVLGTLYAIRPADAENIQVSLP